jgi:pyruvate/2-oxoglutarate dehydrogenase complex dihydrolipoamide dehydrogenase (E3) component
VIEAAPRLLPAADPAASEIISQVFAAEGITVRTGRTVEKIEVSPNGPGCLLRLDDSSEVAATQLLFAAGRTPVTDGLGLDAAGVRTGERGRVVAGRTEGFVKLIAGPRPLTGNLGGGRLLGAAIVASRAGEMIDEVALAMLQHDERGLYAATHLPACPAPPRRRRRA